MARKILIYSSRVMPKHNPFVSCNINNTKEINDIVKESCVKIMPLTRSVECEWINESPLPTNVSGTVNAPPPYTMDIDDSGGNNSCSLSDVAECSIILDKNTPPSEFLPDYNTVYTSGDTRLFSQSHPLPLITEHKHPFGLKNPKVQCFLYARLKNGRIMLWQCPSVRPSVRVFRTFFQRALRYQFETWYMHLVGGTTCRVWVSSQLGHFDLVYSQK